MIDVLPEDDAGRLFGPLFGSPVHDVDHFKPMIPVTGFMNKGR